MPDTPPPILAPGPCGNLAAAVCQVMARCNFVPQTGKNSFHKYSYASDADLLTVLQPAMAEAGLALLPHRVQHQTVEHSPDSKGKTQWRTEVTITYLLIHTSGECLQIEASGCGIDGEDKGIYKAKTGALKYALRHLFLVPTGDDAERHRVEKEAQRREDERRRQEPPAPPGWLLERLCSEAGGWDRATLVEDLRDFVAFAKPKGRVFDPWTLSDERLRNLVDWMAGQTDVFERWLDLRHPDNRRQTAQSALVASGAQSSDPPPCSVCGAALDGRQAHCTAEAHGEPYCTTHAPKETP